MSASMSKILGVTASGLAILALAGCGTSGGRHTASGAAALHFTEGVLTFHDPNPVQERLRGRPVQLPPTTITVSTRNEEGRTVEKPETTVITRTGKAGGRSPGEIFREAAAKAARKPQRIVSPRIFETMWKDLVEAGLLELPRHDGPEPPKNKASIRVRAKGSQVIFVKPVSGFREVRTEAEHRLIATWTTAKSIITQAYQVGD